MTPSSHRSHSPAMRIDAGSLPRANVLYQYTVVIWMRSAGARQRFLWCVGDESLLTCHGEVPSACQRYKLRPMGLEPFAVATGTFVLRPVASNLVRVGHFLDNEARLAHRWSPILRCWTSHRQIGAA